MNARTIKKTVKFGKLNVYGTGRRYPAEVTIELRECGGEPTFTIENGERVYTGNCTPTYTELSICGTVWNSRHTDCIMVGQCLDHMAEFIHSKEFNKILAWWKAYHLNGMNAGTPEQTEAVNEYFKQTGKRYDYTEACEALKALGLYEVNFTGKTVGKEYHNEPYKYGTGWIIRDIPADVLKEIRDYIEA